VQEYDHIQQGIFSNKYSLHPWSNFGQIELHPTRHTTLSKAKRLVRGCNNAEHTLNEKNHIEDNLHHLSFFFLKACQSANLNGSKEAHNKNLSRFHSLHGGQWFNGDSKTPDLNLQWVE